MLVGAGLIAQGAPFWYSVLDSVFGLKRAPAQVGSPGVRPQVVKAAMLAESDASVEAAAAAGGDLSNRVK